MLSAGCARFSDVQPSGIERGPDAPVLTSEEVNEVLFGAS
jgi:hypothetical protein